MKKLFAVIVFAVLLLTLPLCTAAPVFAEGAYFISIAPCENGTASASPESADEGETVTVTINPESGYEVDEIFITFKVGVFDEMVEYSTVEDGVSFSMPAGNVGIIVTFAESLTPPLKGDFNDDNEITVTDALTALRIAAGLISPSEELIRIGDMNGDGEITVIDALTILRIAAGLV